MCSGQFYEKRLLVSERNMKLLLETVTYIAIKERVTCIITIETVMCIMHCKNTTCIIATETPICIITVKSATHILAAETVTCISAAEISNCKITTENHLHNYNRSTNITITESNTSKPA